LNRKFFLKIISTLFLAFIDFSGLCWFFFLKIMILLFLFPLFISATDLITSCTYRTTDGTKYDILPFRSHHKGYRNSVTDSNNLTLYWNFCEPIQSARFHTDLSPPCSDHSFVCLVSPFHTPIDVGRLRIVSDGELGPMTGLSFEFIGGTCGRRIRKSTFHVNCGRETQPTLKILDECHFIVRYNNPYACPNKEQIVY
jgi:hypothetical protein